MSTATYNNDSPMESMPTPFQLLARTAAARPDHPALEYLCEDTTQSLKITYGELFRQVQAVANALKGLGVEKDESVAILLPFVPEAVPALIAAASVGIAFPINLLLSADAIGHQLALSRCRVVVTLGPHPALDVRQRVAAALDGLARMPVVVEVPVAGCTPGALTWSEFISVEPSYSPEGSADRVGMLIHTGGTTGHPKLARLSLRNMAVAALMAASGLGIRESERVLTGLPLFHVGGAIDALFAAMAMGATVVFPTMFGMRNRTVVDHVWKIVEQHHITLLAAVPTTLAAIVDSPIHDVDLGRLRAVMTGGAPLPKDLSLRFQERIGKPVCQLYGMTESSGIATAQLTDGQPVAHTAGKPVPHVQISLGEPGSDYRPGASGEILVRGPNVFQGYLTADGVVDDPQGGWFRSGDLGEVTPNGELKVVGRSKDVIIRSGHNIDPLLIEDIAHAHHAVAQVAAVGMPDDYAGEVPVLFVVPRPGATIALDELSTFIEGRIAEPPARPKHVFILNELPLTPFAKVARFRLRQIAVEFRVRLLLTDLAENVSVSCNDPAAKRVLVTSDIPLSRQQLADIESLLGRFELQLEV